MIKFANICPHCGTEWWEKHECEGTRREAAEKAAEAARVVAEKRARELEAQLNRAPRIVADFDIEPVMYDGPEPGEADDQVNRPRHYTSHPSGVECIDITKHYNFQIGNAMKYLWRQGLKTDGTMDPTEKQIQDCEKAIWYINSFIKDLKEGI